jgi:hypothetical protein
MQKENWNIHLMKSLICSHTLNGTELEHKRNEGYVIVSIVFRVIWMLFTYANNAPNNLARCIN